MRERPHQMVIPGSTWDDLVRISKREGISPQNVARALLIQAVDLYHQRQVATPLELEQFESDLRARQHGVNDQTELTVSNAPTSPHGGGPRSTVHARLHGGPEAHGMVGWYVGLEIDQSGSVEPFVAYVHPNDDHNKERRAAIARCKELLPTLGISRDRVRFDTQPGTGQTYRGHDDIEMNGRSEGLIR